MCSIESIKEQYPLHWLVWNNDFSELEAVLSKDLHDKEKKDCRGRTPLMLAVTLGHLESAKVLVKYLSNVNAINDQGWTVVHEAISTGSREMLKLIMEKRNLQRQAAHTVAIPLLLRQLKEAPDFYVEMKWEFISWVPLVPRMCPSDTYKIYKQGSKVRVDATYIIFSDGGYECGKRSYVFIGDDDYDVVFMEVDHETEEVYSDRFRLLPTNDLVIKRTARAVPIRLRSPIVTTYLDTDKISFERNKSGMWGWRSDKLEEVNSYNCKVFSATNVELVTKTRLEHLSDSDKERVKSSKMLLHRYFALADPVSRQSSDSENTQSTTKQDRNVGKGKNINPGKKASKENSSVQDVGYVPPCTNPYNLTPEEYFDPETDLDGRDIGRLKEVTKKSKKFKANLWLSDDYPLSLQEQIIPIVDLMAISNYHFAKFKDFLQMQIPSGFPVKIEIPLFHILSARITFGNIFGLDDEVAGVSTTERNGKIVCIISDSCFEPPPGYTTNGSENRRHYSLDEDDGLIQFAIQQSLLDAGSEKDEVDIWEALKAQKPSRPSSPNLNSEEDRQLQRAIQASLEVNLDDDGVRTSPDGRERDSPVDEDLSRALELSQRHQEEEERRQKEEEEVMKKVLELSLKEQ